MLEIIIAIVVIIVLCLIVRMVYNKIIDYYSGKFNYDISYGSFLVLASAVFLLVSFFQPGISVILLIIGGLCIAGLIVMNFLRMKNPLHTVLVTLIQVSLGLPIVLLKVFGLILKTIIRGDPNEISHKHR